jgi:hypothetical protein
MGRRLPPAHSPWFFPVFLLNRSITHVSLEMQSFANVDRFPGIFSSTLELSLFHEQCFHLHQPGDRHTVLRAHVNKKNVNKKQRCLTYGITLVSGKIQCLEPATFFATLGDTNVSFPYRHA